MASPQLEDGYFKIANEIAEALTRTNLSAYQSRILCAIFRKTYGYRKKEDWISNGQLVELTGLHKQHVWRTVTELIDRNMVTKGGYKLAFQKDYQRWRELPKGVTSHHELPKGVTQLPKGVTKVTKGGGHKIKQYTKDTMRDSPVLTFTQFWEAYPNKKGRKAAEKAWDKLAPPPELVETILEAVEEQKHGEEWKRDGGRFISHPARWLNDQRWEDAVQESGSRW